VEDYRKEERRLEEGDRGGHCSENGWTLRMKRRRKKKKYLM
jgi:hypothetical protein